MANLVKIFDVEKQLLRTTPKPIDDLVLVTRRKDVLAELNRKKCRLENGLKTLVNSPAVC